MLMLQFTGLSGSGKSTLARLFKDRMARNFISVEIIDGDAYRRTYCSDLGYSKADRIENIRRLGVVASGVKAEVVIIAAINPYEEAREELRRKYGARLIYLMCELDVLIERDTKGLYKRVLLSQDNPLKVSNLTGVNDPFEFPDRADLTLHTGSQGEKECVESLLAFVLEQQDMKAFNSSFQ